MHVIIKKIIKKSYTTSKMSTLISISNSQEYEMNGGYIKNTSTGFWDWISGPGGYVRNTSTGVWDWISGPGGYVRNTSTGVWDWIPGPGDYVKNSLSGFK
jgi:hypothetical protein